MGNQGQGDFLSEINNFIDILGKDVTYIFEKERQLQCSDKMDEEQINILRRTYVRNSFAFVEGLTNILKKSALILYQGESIEIEASEQLLLQDLDFDLNERGEVITKKAKISLSKNIKFAFRSYAKAANYDFELDISNSGWNCIINGAKIRDRLMHPKKSNDLVISDKDYNTVREGIKWFRNQILTCLIPDKQELAHILKTEDPHLPTN
jgi:hypothetical protein